MIRNILKQLRLFVEYVIVRFLFLFLYLIPINTVSKLGGYLFKFFGPFSQSHKTALSNFKKVLVTVGLAHAPGLLRFFAVIPDLVIPIVFFTQFWIFAALVIGIREVLNFKSNFKSFGVVLIAFLIIAFISVSYVVNNLSSLPIN